MNQPIRAFSLSPRVSTLLALLRGPPRRRRRRVVIREPRRHFPLLLALRRADADGLPVRAQGHLVRLRAGRVRQTNLLEHLCRGGARGGRRRRLDARRGGAGELLLPLGELLAQLEQLCRLLAQLEPRLAHRARGHLRGLDAQLLHQRLDALHAARAARAHRRHRHLRRNLDDVLPPRVRAGRQLGGRLRRRVGIRRDARWQDGRQRYGQRGRKLPARDDARPLLLREVLQTHARLDRLQPGRGKRRARARGERLRLGPSPALDGLHLVQDVLLLALERVGALHLVRQREFPVALGVRVERVLDDGVRGGLLGNVGARLNQRARDFVISSLHLLDRSVFTAGALRRRPPVVHHEKAQIESL
mmetsp:Transcript_8753/g.36664  ORF Transcript_8753/g.36664 Transcript_8753/m.36664 type:complete len:361 (-) Transcript_8753:661-1743(-)